MALTADYVGSRYADLRSRIVAAGGSLDEIKVVAVTKGHDAAARAAVDAGLTDLGENYAAELLTKATALEATGVRWHFLGHVQRNKVRALAPLVTLWQGVDRPAAGEEIARRAPGAEVLVQVNLEGEPQKNGCSFEQAPALVESLAGLGLTVRGLMALGVRDDLEASRRGYRRLVRLAGELGLEERSIGMSHDLEVAVSEGSTMVRVGEALFGPRNPRTQSYDLRR